MGGEKLSIKNWFREGAELEDAGTKIEALAGKARYLNHFHNPLKPWLDAGLTGFFSGESALLWAQDGGKQTFSVGGDWSWLTLRHFYYLALTSTTNADRQAYFAQTFMGLGQQIHLIQDMAQPAHVRNDPHPFDDAGPLNGFEFWAKQMENDNIVKPLMAAPVFPTIDASTTISRFYDTDQYDGANPSTSLTLGLAEYTNANFASEDTITSFPYPRLTDMQYYEEPAGTWGSFYKYRKYYRKTGAGEKIEHFVNAGRLTKYLDAYTVQQTNTLGMDDKVYSDYASFLLPRAVGYSAGLLNYFFRGEMEMEKDPENPGQYIIKNKTGEIMSGTFTLYYDYEEGTEIKRKAVESWVLTEENGKAIRAKDKSEPLALIHPIDPAPKEQGKYILVFQGKLGNEEGAIVGKIINLNRFFEDWEYGYTGRYPWRVCCGWDIASMYPIIDGFDGHESKVLQTYSISPIGGPWFPEPIPLTKEVSFDYYVPGPGGYGCGNFSLYLIPSSGYNCEINLRQENCYGYGNVSMLFEFNKWVHIVVPKEKLPCSDFKGVQMGSSNGVALYIDNISIE